MSACEHEKVSVYARASMQVREKEVIAVRLVVILLLHANVSQMTHE